MTEAGTTGLSLRLSRHHASHSSDASTTTVSARPPHQIHHRHGVLARLRVIAVAEQKRPIDHRRADLVLRRLHQTQTEVAREGAGVIRIAEGDEITGYLSLRRQDDDATWVGEQVVLGVVPELKADGVGQPQDGHLLAGEEVPACLHAGQAVALDV